MDINPDHLINCNFSDLTNEQLLQNISSLKQRVEYYYCKELRRLEKNKRKAIIKDLNEFRRIQEKYNLMKSISPFDWLENWEVYNAIKKEAEKRSLPIKEKS